MSATQSKPTAAELRREAKRLGLAPDVCGRPIEELIGEASQHDDPLSYLAIFAPPETGQAVGDVAETEGNETAGNEVGRGGDQTEPLAASPAAVEGANAAALAAPGPSLADRLDDALAKSQAEKELDRAEAQAFYLKVVLGEGTPTERAVESLAEVCEELGISSDQLKRDIEIIARARKQQDLHDHSDEYIKSVAAIRAARDRVKRENDQRLVDADRALRRVQELARLSNLARDELATLARERPELFNLSVWPPRLLPAEPDRAAGAPVTD